MNTIIGLRGKGGTGKTTTIGKLFEILKKNDYEIQSSSFVMIGIDFKAILFRNNIKIGISSWGDSYNLVFNALKELMDADCTICVCACRTYDRINPGTNAAIIQFTDYEHKFIEKTIANNTTTIDEASSRDADILFAEIEKLFEIQNIKS
jgi:acetolactate synthase regulatory subunit